MSPESIADALRRLIADVALRQRMAEAAHLRALDFTRERCADRTLAFLRDTWEQAGARAGNRR
jgi:glycosyltransferase involved in cell wall biosynthesis